MRLKTFGFIIIIVNIILASFFLFHRDIIFHTDIARDFLLLEQTVDHRDLTLIGPRSGGVPGVFHGPLWLYLNVPAYIFGGGNPFIVGLFWLLLSITAIGILYYVAKRLFDENTAILSAVLLSTFAIGYTDNLFNPFGALILSPVFFLLFLKYLKNKSFVTLTMCLFVLGLMIQFQMAFGVPVMVLTAIYLFVFMYKQKKLMHLLSFFILLVPLSTYILFELKHNFLQIHSVMQYFAHPPAYTKYTPFKFMMMRLSEFIFKNNGLIPPDKWFLSVPILGSFFYYFFKQKHIRHKQVYYLFFYFYVGYWVITLFYKDIVWDYYTWPFLPLVVMVFASSWKFMNRKIFTVVFVFLLACAYFLSARGTLSYQKEVSNGATWQYHDQVARQIFTDAPKEFGYYIYTPDQFGYSFKYAMHYEQKVNHAKQSFPYEKKETVYLIIAPPPDDKPFLNGKWWRSNQVKITKKPDSVKKYPSGLIVEKYHLTPDEIKVSSDPNLIQTLIFR